MDFDDEQGWWMGTEDVILSLHGLVGKWLQENVSAPHCVIEKGVLYGRTWGLLGKSENKERKRRSSESVSTAGLSQFLTLCPLCSLLALHIGHHFHATGH